MAIPFLSNVDFNQNEAKNLKLHINSGDITSPSPVDGQIFFDSADNRVKIYHTNAFHSIAGDITGISITAGAGLTGTVSTTLGSHTQTIDVVGGDGITANADEIEVAVDDTTIELSATNGSGVVQAKTAAVANGGTALATGDQIYDFVVGYADAAGTDNSTDVTLVTTAHDYLSISGQAITLGAIQLGSTGQDVTGTLPIANGGTGQTTAAAAANALLNTSQGGSLSIGDANDDITIPGDLIVTGQTTFINETILVAEDNTIAFEGTTSGDNLFIKLTSAEPTSANKTITLPDLSGHVALLAAAATETITATPAELNLLDGITTLSGSNTGDEPDASKTVKGIVELATSAETKTGTDTARAVTPDSLAARTVVATIDVSNSTLAGQTAPFKATIAHSLGTKDLIVQLQDVTTFEVIHADISTVDFAGSESTSEITIGFDNALPTNDVRVIITSGAGATSITPTYA